MNLINLNQRKNLEKQDGGKKIKNLLLQNQPALLEENEINDLLKFIFLDYNYSPEKLLYYFSKFIILNNFYNLNFI